jgi:mRNA-degrading endonuclease RelE of RelBE toxin-antitoxin system
MKMTRLKLVKSRHKKSNLKKLQRHVRTARSSFLFKSIYNFHKKKSILGYGLTNSKSVVINFQPTFTKKLNILVPKQKRIFLNYQKTNQSPKNFNTVFKLRLPLRKSIFKTRKLKQLSY